jgi:hypothetical protein
MQTEYAALRKLNTEQPEYTETEIKLKIYRSLGMAIMDDMQPTSLAEAASSVFEKPIRVRLRTQADYCHRMFSPFICRFS